MSRKKPQFTENIIPLLDRSQEYRSELLHMQLYFNKMLRALRNPRNSNKTIKNIRQQREYLLHVLNETTSSVNDNEDINENLEKVIEFPNDQVKS